MASLQLTWVRYQIKAFKTEDIPQFTRYKGQDVLTLIRLLRLALILNKSRQATEETSQITLKTDRTLMHWQLTFAADYLQHNPLIKNELTLEQGILKEIGGGLVFG